MKFLAFLLFSLLLESCGVKGDPVTPKGSQLPRVQDSYLQSSPLVMLLEDYLLSIEKMEEETSLLEYILKTPLPSTLQERYCSNLLDQWKKYNAQLRYTQYHYQRAANQAKKLNEDHIQKSLLLSYKKYQEFKLFGENKKLLQEVKKCQSP